MHIYIRIDRSIHKNEHIFDAILCKLCNAMFVHVNFYGEIFNLFYSF